MIHKMNAGIATRLGEVADILEAQQANPYRVQAYRRAAMTVRDCDRPMDEAVREEGVEGLQNLPGIGESLSRTIHQLVTSGDCGRALLHISDLAGVNEVKARLALSEPALDAPRRRRRLSCADACDDDRLNSRLGERFDYADVRQPAHAAAAQSQFDLAGAKHMKRVIHRPGLYTGDFDDAAEAICRLRRIEEALKRSNAHEPRRSAISYRNWWARGLDALLAAARRYAPPLHWLWVVVVALGFFIYARLAAATVRLTVAGERPWPDVPSPCVMAMWHGCANSWLVVVARRKPRSPMAIMIARDPRGDCLALFCRLLGLRVVRGESGESGWEALAELAREMARGVCAVITADGGGPARVPKVGAVALASATGAPLMPVGADCSPAIYERHKWDRVRTPLPFGRVTIALGQLRDCPTLTDLAPIEEARRRLQDALNEVAETAQRAVGMRDMTKRDL